jgi:hypothetical protein
MICSFLEFLDINLAEKLVLKEYGGAISLPWLF